MTQSKAEKPKADDNALCVNDRVEVVFGNTSYVGAKGTLLDSTPTHGMVRVALEVNVPLKSLKKI